MFTKNPKIIHDPQNLDNYIQGTDVFNSVLLYKLKNTDCNRIEYTITSHQYRPDLIAEDIYGSPDWQGILVYQLGIPLESYSKGTTLYVIPKEIIEDLIKSLGTDGNH